MLWVLTGMLWVLIKASRWNASNESSNELGDNYIQMFHLGRYIIGYTVGNLVLRRHTSGAVKRDFLPYIQRYTSPNENFEYGYPHSNALLQFLLNLECCKPHNAACHPTKCDVINDIKMFPAVYRRIYCRKFLTLSNHKSHYKSKCIRMFYDWYPIKGYMQILSNRHPDEHV